MKRVLGYADRISARPGDRLQVMVSCEAAGERFEAALFRLICGDDSPAGPGFKVEAVAHPANGTYPARRQQSWAGSCALLPAPPALGSFTFAALVWPTTPGAGRQAVFGSFVAAARRGLSLGIDAAGQGCVRFGDGETTGELSSGRPLAARRWTLLAASWDAGERHLRLVQQELPGFPAFAAPPPAVLGSLLGAAPDLGELPLLLAAASVPGGDPRATAEHFNGKIEAPLVASRALAPEALLAALRDPPSLGGDLVAAWDLAAEIPTDRVVDRGPGGRHGRTVNLPTRAVTGSLWDGSEHDWRRAPAHYAAIHFHDDDLYDAGWVPDLALALPAGLRSGLYALRLSFAGDEDWVPFFVTPAAGATRAPVAYLAATATYTAYANPHYAFDDPIDEVSRGTAMILRPEDLHLNAHRELGLSTYDTHSDGSGVCFSTRLRPVLNMRPRSRLWNFNADTFVIDWLESLGQPYDVITDEELHADGAAALAPYRVVITGSHPEYYTTAMSDGLAGWLAGGGRLMYLGGNGFYWRAAYSPHFPGAVEVRRAEGGTRTWAAPAGEYHHAFTGERGGLWRNLGRPPQRLVGVGFAAEGFDVSSYFRRREGARDPRAAFVFAGLGDDDVIGDYGGLGGGAAGIELDRADALLGTPPHALVLASSEGHSNVYVPTPEEILAMYPGLDGVEHPDVRADMVFFETPAGGAVWSTGSIAWSCALAWRNHDNDVARITTNVLRRFLDETEFVVPTAAMPSR
jgi:N,N-dimethylformamidase